MKRVEVETSPLQASHLEVLKKQIQCDVVFEVGPQKERIACHKIFLIARSPVFEVMFENRWANTTGDSIKQSNYESNSAVATANVGFIMLPDVESESFHHFLNFIYADVLAVDSVPQVEKLLYLAEKYDVSSLKDKCEEILTSKLGLKDVVQLHSVAEKYSLIPLLETTCHIILKELSALISESSFLTMNATDITPVVDDVSVRVFNALINWAMSQCNKFRFYPSDENLRSVLAGIFVPIMNSEEFREQHINVPQSILTDQEKLVIFERIALDREGRYNFDAPFKGSNGNQLISFSATSMSSSRPPPAVVFEDRVLQTLIHGKPEPDLEPGQGGSYCRFDSKNV